MITSLEEHGFQIFTNKIYIFNTKVAWMHANCKATISLFPIKLVVCVCILLIYMSGAFWSTLLKLPLYISFRAMGWLYSNCSGIQILHSMLCQKFYYFSWIKYCRSIKPNLSPPTKLIVHEGPLTSQTHALIIKLINVD